MPDFGDLVRKSARSVMAERAYGSIYSAQYADAMKSAQANEVATRLGVPPDIVEADFPNMVAEDKLRRARAETFRNPVYASMMQRPRFAATAMDDPAVPKTAQAIYQLRNGVRGERSNPYFRDRVARYGYVGAFARSLRDTVGAAGSMVGQGLAGLVEATFDNVEMVANRGPLTFAKSYQPSNPISQAARRAGDFYKGQQRATTVRYDNWYADTAARGIESVPMSLTALGAAASGNPGAGVALLSSIQGGQSYREGREAGLDPARALAYGTSQASLEAAGEALPIFRYADDVLKGSGFFKKLAGQLVSENIGEQFTNHLQDLNTWSMIEANQGKTFADYLAERPGAALSIAVATTAAAGLQTGAAHAIERSIDRIEARRADARAGRFLDKVMEGAAGIQARSVNPTEFREAIGAELAGTPAETLYVSPQAVRSLFQSDDEMTDHAFWGGFADEIHEAEAIGGDVAVPLADAVTHLAGTPEWGQLRDHVRLSPGGDTRAEIAEWEAAFDDARQKTGEELAAMLSEELDVAEPMQRVHEQMRDKLIHAGYRPDTANHLAAQFAHRQRVRAERMLRELTGTEADVVDVVQVLPEKLARTIAMAELPDKGLSEVIAEMKRDRGARSDKAKFGHSLIEFIQKKGGVEDPGGDLKSMGAAPFKGKARKGEKKLIRASGEKGGMFGPSGANANSLDNMALLAWEAGYFPEFSERPSVNDLLDALGEELGGRSNRYAADNTNEDDQLREAAQELYALLDQQGIDPAKASPREISAAVKRYQEQAATGRSYGQDGLFDDPTQPSRTMTQAQRSELEARQKQSMMRRGGQQAVSDQEGGLFSAERDQRSLFQGDAIASVEGTEIAPAGTGVTRLRQAARKWFTDNLRGKAERSRALDAEVTFASPKKMLAFSADEQKLRMIPALPALIRDGELLWSRPPYEPGKEVSVRAYHRLGGLVDIAGDIKWAEVTIRETADGKLFYDHIIPENNAADPEAPDNKAGPGDGDAFFQLAEEGDSFNVTLRSADQSYAEGGARGRITFMANGPNVIELFEKRDLSTFIHETGHLYLEELRFDASEAGPDSQLGQDWQTVMDWFAANGHAMDQNGEIPVEAHELFARGFERYAMEGKAPSTALRKAFEAFRSWLLSIYRLVDNLRAPITPEIRDVMARLVATDEEIEAARSEQQIKALFDTAEAAGMTEAEFAAYHESLETARDEAFDELLKKTMAPIRAARSKENREREAAVRNEVTDEIDAQPVYRALNIIKTGAEGQGMKLDREALIESYGPDIIDALPRAVPPLYASKGTMDADVIAEQAGFESGEAMIRALIGYEDARQALKADGDKRNPRQVAIDEGVAQRMAERYGDPLRDGSIEEEAMALIHNDRQGEVIGAEIKALGRRTGQRATPYAIARKWARERIRGGAIAEHASGAALQRYERAARRAATAAEQAILSGDAEEAFRQKQSQMLNNALISEGRKARDEVEAAVSRLSKTARRKTAKSIDQDYLDQAHALLESVELRDRSQASIDRQASFEEWAAEQRANGVDIVTPAGFAEHIGRRHWSRLTVDEITGLDDTVKQILHLGRLKQTLLDGAERRARDEVIAEMEATADGIGRGPRTPDNDPSRSFAGGLKSKLLGADALLLKVEQLVDWLDKGKPNGVWNRMLFKPLAEAQGREADMMRDYVERINQAIKGIPAKQIKDWRRKVDTPELRINVEGHPMQGEPWSFYKDQVVMIALNMGNEGNRQRLLDGYGWNENAVMAVLDRTMTAEDWTFVQEVWDTIDSLWPEVEALERRVNGVAPDKIEATPIETRHGVFKGGYFPAVYDPAWSSRTDDQQAESLLESGYVRANVRSSATKARAAQVRRPMLLSMEVITRHLSEVIHDITHREALTEAWRLASDDRVQRIIAREMGAEYSQMLKPWLKHIANDQARNANSNNWLVGFLRGIGHNITIVGLGYRLTSTLAQVAGMPNIVAYIGGKRMAEGWGRFLANPVSTFNEVRDKSAEMRDRFSTMDRDIVEMMRRQAKSRGVEALKGPGWFTKYALHGILAMDAILTTAGWVGAYRKGMAEGLTEEEAIYAADKMVRMSQGAGGAKDQAAITREHQAVKLFTMFFSYFSALYAQQRNAFHTLRRASGAREKGAALNFGFWVMVMPPLVDALIRGLISGHLPGGQPGDDDDDETWGKWAAQRVIFGNIASIPGVREIGGAIDNGFGYRASPVQNIGESLTQGWGNLEKALDGDDDTEASPKWVKQTLNLFGLIAGKPTGQIGASAQFGYDVATGEVEPENAGDVLEGVTTGKVEAN